MSLNASKPTHSFDDKSRPPPAPTLSNRKLRAMGESVRRADGSFGEKQPKWPTLREMEDQRLEILKKVSLVVISICRLFMFGANLSFVGKREQS